MYKNFTKLPRGKRIWKVTPILWLTLVNTGHKTENCFVSSSKALDEHLAWRRRASQHENRPRRHQQRGEDCKPPASSPSQLVTVQLNRVHTSPGFSHYFFHTELPFFPCFLSNKARWIFVFRSLSPVSLLARTSRSRRKANSPRNASSQPTEFLSLRWKVGGVGGVGVRGAMER